MHRLSLSRFSLLLIAVVVGLTGLNGCAAGDPNLAGARMELRTGDHDRALELIDEALAANPNNAEAYQLRGDVYQAKAQQAQGDRRADYYENMREAYMRALELDPARGLVEVRLLQAYGEEMNRGAAAYGEGAEQPNRFLDAASAFQNAGRIMPDSTDAHLFQGLALIQAGETAAAIEPLQRAVDRNIEQPEAYFYLGQLYMVEDRADEAIAVLEAARERFPQDRDIETELLNIYARTGQTERALEAYEAAVADQPDDAVMRYNYGSFLLQAQRYDEAVEQLQRAVQLDPTAGNAHFNLGAAYMNQAVEINEQLGEMDTAAPEAAQLLAQRDSYLQQAVEPLEAARRIFEQEGEDVEIVCRSLFRAYALLRMDAEAREAAACAGIDLD